MSLYFCLEVLHLNGKFTYACPPERRAAYGFKLIATNLISKTAGEDKEVSFPMDAWFLEAGVRLAGRAASRNERDASLSDGA